MLDETSQYQGISQVRHAIEKCLLMDMSSAETVAALHQQGFEQGFVHAGNYLLFFIARRPVILPHTMSFAVWEKMESSNRDFFKAYHIRLRLKTHITSFNMMAEKQSKVSSRYHSLTCCHLSRDHVNALLIMCRR